KPANDYVRDFISNVNPLSVLTAWNVMRDRRDLEADTQAGWVWLDRRRTTRFRLAADDTVEAAERDGTPIVIGSCEQLAPAATPRIYRAQPATPLKTVIHAMHLSQAAPVALFDNDMRLVGAIGV